MVFVFWYLYYEFCDLLFVFVCGVLCLWCYNHVFCISILYWVYFVVFIIYANCTFANMVYFSGGICI